MEPAVRVGGDGLLKRTLIWIGVLAVAVAVGFGLGALTYEPPAPELDVAQAVAPSPSTATPGDQRPAVPDLVGTHRAAAETKLEELGVLFVIDPVSGREDDRVVRQDPAPGTWIQPATNVLLQVRCDPKPCPPPPEGKQLYDPCSCAWR